jgi:hypothetical protein
MRIVSPHIGHSFAAIDFSPTGTYRSSSSMSGNTFRPFGGDHVAVVASEDSRHDISCFADEVVVDFPSVASAIDRIRRGFLVEERTAPLSTAIQLSRREAREGATLPLEVPVRCTCRQCGGRGESWARACAHCQGSGTELLSHRLQVAVPPGVVDGDYFTFTVTARHHPPTRIELRVRVA